jgi:mannose-1-phosphate guanylyltransferase
MVRRIISWLASHGVTELVLNLHHLPHTLTAVVGDGSDLAAAVRYSWEPVVLGSAGGPRRALPILGVDTFFIVNGDTLTDVNLKALADAHESAGALVTMALVPNREPDRYGGVSLDERRRVTGFPRRASTGSARTAEGRSYHFVGVQIANAEAFAALADGRPVNSVGGVYDELLAARPGAICGYVCDAAFWDVGTAGDYWRTSVAWAEKTGGAFTPGPGSTVAPTAVVTRSIIWNDVTIGAGSTVDACIITDGVRVPEGSRYARQILVRSANGGVRATPFDGQT